LIDYVSKQWTHIAIKSEFDSLYKQ
jgi:hypothetical protein